MFVDSILSNKGKAVVTVTSDSTIGDLVSELASHNIGAIVVVDDGKVTGIVSERDVVRHLAGSAPGFRSRPVSTVMTKAPKTCKPGDSIESVMTTMSRGRFRHLPVLDGDDLIGIISIGDVVKLKIEEAEQEAGALRDYISS